jgi:hypothetical protein
MTEPDTNQVPQSPSTADRYRAAAAAARELAVRLAECVVGCDVHCVDIDAAGRLKVVTRRGETAAFGERQTSGAEADAAAEAMIALGLATALRGRAALAEAHHRRASRECGRKC